MKNVPSAGARVPSSTYRLQLNRSLPFAKVLKIVDYLHELGVGDCYLSPFLMARPGSVHGYDVTDHTKCNPEIGDWDDFRRLAEELKRRNMGIMMDVVPNHMCIADPSNWRWCDVLENGPSSPQEKFFDIDWHPPREDLANKVLLPILGDQYGLVLENQQIHIEYSSGAFIARVYETPLPLAPRTWTLILLPAATALTEQLGASNQRVLEMESIITALNYLPLRTETDEAKMQERQREKEIIKRRLAALVDSTEAVRRVIDDQLRRINGTKGDPRSFDVLEEMLSDQAYRVSFWRVAADEINYRRFFDINELAAIRVEDPRVFAEVHEIVLGLIQQGWVTGLRIDHPDGLFDPERYFRDLQEACSSVLPGAGGTAPSDRPFFVVAEKIVIGTEELRPDWAVCGTTGYGFLNFLNGLFVHPAGRRAFRNIYARFTGSSRRFEDLLYESKSLILRVAMSSELNVLARRLDRICQQHRLSRDFTLESLRFALREIVSCFPVYRTYIRAGHSEVDEEDRRHILFALNEAKRRNPATSESIFDVIGSILLLEDPDDITDQQRAERRLFVMRFQQLTGPVMAKGMEDTAFYRFYPLASLNEVGGDPRQFGVSPRFFHRKNRIRLASWPHALLATSTHDTKRSEDVRARINVLSEIALEWYQAINRWRELNTNKKVNIGGLEAPSGNEEYLLYQTLIGAWPLEPMENAAREAFLERIQNYMEKALKEAKVHTSWINPNEAYDRAVRRFVADILDPAPENLFPAAFQDFVGPVAYAGLMNSLSQTLLKIAAPGVPDFYQGTELWDLSLVDPDNRHPVDFDHRKALLASLREESSVDPAALAERMMREPRDGRVKLYITARGLCFRRSHHQLFARGAYWALRALGERQKHVVAFARTHGRQAAIAVAGRFFLKLGIRDSSPVGDQVWGDSALLLGDELLRRTYRDVFTGRTIEPQKRGGNWRLPLAEVFSHLPVALLERVQ